MADWPTIPSGFGYPLVDMDTHRLPEPTMAAVMAAAVDEDFFQVTDLGDKTGAVALTQSQTRSTFTKMRLTGNVTVTLAAGVAGVAYSTTIRIAQDGTGNRTLILANVASSYAVPIVLSTGANQVDVLRCEWDGTAWTAYLGGAALAIPASWVV